MIDALTLCDGICLTGPRPNLQRGKHGSDTRRRSQEHSAFQARQHLLPEHCRVLVNGGRVEYVTDTGKKQLYWNIPIANTTSILLGTGTSVTQAAMRELAKAGVLVGFAAAEAHRCSAPTSWMSRWPGSHRKANIGRRNTCRPGSGSGSTTGCACMPPQAARLQCLHAAWTTRHARVRFRGGRRTSDGAAAASRYADRQCAGRHRVAGRRSAAD